MTGIRALPSESLAELPSLRLGMLPPVDSHFTFALTLEDAWLCSAFYKGALNDILPRDAGSRADLKAPAIE